MNERKFNSQTLFTKWLLAIVLLCGVLSFHGTALQARPKQNLLYTEAAWVAKKHAIKSLTYQRVLKQVYIRRYTLSVFTNSTIDLAYFDSLLERARVKAYNDKNINDLQNSFFYQPVASAQKGDEPAIALI